MKEMIKTLHAELDQYVTSFTTIKNTNQALIHWYMDTQYPDHKSDWLISDGTGDGEIDAIVKTKDGITHIIQFKNNENFHKQTPVTKCDVKKWEKFFETVDVFEKSDNRQFKKWLKDAKIRSSLYKDYTDAFKAVKKDTYRFKFVTTFSMPAQPEKKFKKIGNENVDTIVTLLKLYNDSGSSLTPHADPITLSWDEGEQFVTWDDKLQVNSVTARIYIKDILDYLKQRPATRQRLIARNVRTRLDSPINKDIVNTFVNFPEEFWYSHNGITMICHELNIDEDKLEMTLTAPNVINGAQTVMSLADVTKVNPETKVLVRIFENKQFASESQELLDKIIFRTNQQNKLPRWQLKAHDDKQVKLSKEFDSVGVFYIRRKNEDKYLNTSGRFRGGKLKMDELAKLRVASLDTDGPVIARGTIDKLFEDKYYKKLFVANFNQIFFEFCMYTLTNSLMKKLSQPKIKQNLRMTLFYIFLESARKHTNFSDWKNKLKKNNGSILNYKTTSPEKKSLDKLFAIYKKCYTTCNNVKNEEKRNRGEDLTLRIYIKDKEINKKAIKRCLSFYKSDIQKHFKQIFNSI